MLSKSPRIQLSWALALSLTITLGKSLDFSVPQFTHWLSGCDDVLRGLLGELDELMLASKPVPQCASCYREHLLQLISGSPSHGGQMKRERGAGEGQGVRLGELTQSEGPVWPSLRTVEKLLPSLLGLSLALLSGFSLPPSRGPQGCWDPEQQPARGGPAMAQSGACTCLGVQGWAAHRDLGMGSHWRQLQPALESFSQAKAKHCKTKKQKLLLSD